LPSIVSAPAAYRSCGNVPLPSPRLFGSSQSQLLVLLMTPLGRRPKSSTRGDQAGY